MYLFELLTTQNQISMSSYLSVYRLQVNVYCKEWWQTLILLGQITIVAQGAYTEIDNAPVWKEWSDYVGITNVDL